jgi:LPS sulfotransferase NodH
MIQAKKKIPFRWKYLVRQLASSTVGRIAGLALPPVKRVVIITNGRTGSNLLVSYLNQSPEIRAYGEVFGGYYLRDAAMLDKVQKVGAIAHLEDMLRRTSTERVVCAKILYRDFEERYHEKRNIPSMARLFGYLVSNEDIRVIHLRRENLLDVIVSKKLAEQSGKFVGGDYAVQQAEISPGFCRRRIEFIKAQEDMCREAFSGPRYLEMTYEELNTDASTALKRLQDFLDVGAFRAQSHHKKQNKAARSQAITNYDELKAHFSGTPFARYFD